MEENPTERKDDLFLYGAELVLNHLESKFLKGNAEVAWQAIVHCDCFGLPYPQWVRDYISKTALKLVMAPLPDLAGGEILSEALGGIDKWKLNAIRTEEKNFEVYLGVERLITKGVNLEELEKLKKENFPLKDLKKITPNEGLAPDLARRVFSKLHESHRLVKKTNAREAHKELRKLISAQVTETSDLSDGQKAFLKQFDADAERGKK